MSIWTRCKSCLMWGNGVGKSGESCGNCSSTKTIAYAPIELFDENIIALKKENEEMRSLLEQVLQVAPWWSQRRDCAGKVREVLREQIIRQLEDGVNQE